jgi:hypothetical protein
MRLLELKDEIEFFIWLGFDLWFHLDLDLFLTIIIIKN